MSSPDINQVNTAQTERQPVCWVLPTDGTTRLTKRHIQRATAALEREGDELPHSDALAYGTCVGCGEACLAMVGGTFQLPPKHKESQPPQGTTEGPVAEGRAGPHVPQPSKPVD